MFCFLFFYCLLSSNSQAAVGLHMQAFMHLIISLLMNNIEGSPVVLRQQAWKVVWTSSQETLWNQQCC